MKKKDEGSPPSMEIAQLVELDPVEIKVRALSLFPKKTQIKSTHVMVSILFGHTISTSTCVRSRN